MKVLLLTPPKNNTRETTYLTPPVGLAYIAAYLKRGGVDVHVIDAQAESLGFSELAGRVEKLGPDVVGISAFTTQINDTNKILGMIKSIDGKTVTVVGGYHASAAPNKTLKDFANIDFVIIGEGEYTFLELVRTVEKNGELSRVKGILYRGENGKIITTEPRPLIEDLDELPMPAWELFPLSKYTAIYTKKKSLQLPVSTSRGCPFGCIFCYRVLGDRTRFRSPESVVKEIERNINVFGASQILFSDETFTLRKERTIELCDMIIYKGINRLVGFVCESRVDLVDRQILEKMKECNFTHVAYGIESGNQDILNKACKGIDLKKAEDAVRITKNLGIKTHTTFIFGLPFETRKTARDTIDFAIKLDADYSTFAILTPFPGTEARKMAKESYGNLKIITDDWKRYDKHKGSSLELVNMNRKTLESIQRKAYMKFYLRPGKIKNMFELVNPIAMLEYFIKQVKNVWN